MWTAVSVTSAGSSPASAWSSSPAGLPSWALRGSSVGSVVEPSPEPSSEPSPSPSPSPSETTTTSECGTTPDAPCFVALSSDSMSIAVGVGLVLVVSLLMQTIAAVRQLTR